MSLDSTDDQRIELRKCDRGFHVDRLCEDQRRMRIWQARDNTINLSGWTGINQLQQGIIWLLSNVSSGCSPNMLQVTYLHVQRKKKVWTCHASIAFHV